jgi:rhamnose transport system ATP-binding protein
VSALRDGKHVGTRPIAEAPPAELIRLMVGREIAAVYPKRAVPIGDVVLQVDNLGCSETGVRSATFAVRAGEIVGIAGLVGAGRTELARVLFGVTPADSGVLRMSGREVHVDSPRTAIAHGIAYVPEDRRRHGVVPEFSVAVNTSLAVLRSIANGAWLDFRAETSLAQEYVRRLGVKTASLSAPASSLSGGNQQKVALARWLATEPRVLILDEPTQGVDVGAKAEIHAMMVELAAAGLAILMISSELPEVLGMSDRILVMRGGRIVGDLPRAEAAQERIMALAVGGDA